MKGLEIARGYFFDECLPRLEREVPEALPLLAAGLVGEGSDCFGFDDEKSRDHDWGPGFCLWLPREALDEFSAPIVAVLGSMKDEYRGFKARKMGLGGRVGLRTTEGFYHTLLGCEGIPQSADQWLEVPESALAAAVNGEVFMDNHGGFSAMRQALVAHYPEDVRLRKLACCCAMAAQTGQYNYARSYLRGDSVAMGVIKGRFAENAARAVFLLNRVYAPFYKWTYRALGGLGPLGEQTREKLEKLFAADDREAVEIIEDISAGIIAQLRAEGLSSSDSDFLMDHCGELLMKIEDADLRARPVSLVF